MSETISPEDQRTMNDNTFTTLRKPLVNLKPGAVFVRALPEHPETVIAYTVHDTVSYLEYQTDRPRVTLTVSSQIGTHAATEFEIDDYSFEFVTVIQEGK